MCVYVTCNLICCCNSYIKIVFYLNILNCMVVLHLLYVVASYIRINNCAIIKDEMTKRIYITVSHIIVPGPYVCVHVV